MTPKCTAHGFLAFFFFWLLLLHIADNDPGELSMTTTRPVFQVATLSSEFSITQAWFSVIFSSLEKLMFENLCLPMLTFVYCIFAHLVT